MKRTAQSNPPQAGFQGFSTPGECSLRLGMGALVLSLLSLLVTGCGMGGGVPSTPIPEGDGPLAAEAALEATRPETPTRLRFDFRVKEADLRFNGQGLARIEPPYRVRLDLFSGGGETLFQAALVEGTLRIPAWAPRELAPPPALLWASLGIFRPDPDLRLLGGREDEAGRVTLRYGRDDALELRFTLTEGRLTRAELHEDGHLTEEVDLSLDGETGTVVETVYRNLALFLELTFSLESSEHVSSFAPDIWYPGF
jgi:hypothetical protein